MVQLQAQEGNANKDKDIMSANLDSNEAYLSLSPSFHTLFE